MAAERDSPVLSVLVLNDTSCIYFRPYSGYNDRTRLPGLIRSIVSFSRQLYGDDLSEISFGRERLLIFPGGRLIFVFHCRSHINTELLGQIAQEFIELYLTYPNDLELLELSRFPRFRLL